MWSTRYMCYALLFWGIIANIWQIAQTQERANDNGGIYVVNVARLMQDRNDELTSRETETTATELTNTADNNSNSIDFDGVMTLCNVSFSIPMDYIVEFNNTGKLPDIIDKTGMCFIRCVYEKYGLINNWQLNTQKIRANIWPATGDSIEVCQQEGKNEANACVRTYAIAKCLTTRALVDAPNKPTV